MADNYDALEKSIDWSQADAGIVPLTDDHLQQLQQSYNKPFHLAKASELPGSTINQHLEFDAITRRYRDHPFGATYIDNFLTDSALLALRNYLLESTIWFDYRHIGGHVAAYLETGLACPFVLQIAEDMRQSFPEIFKHHALKQIWAFKNVARQQKIDIHVDDAAVSINLWITPDHANLDPGHGGLIVHEFEAPRDWRLKNYDRDIAHLRETIAEENPNIINIPHKQNRAIVFNSDIYA